MKVGYIRVSTEEQNTIRQEILMQDLGVERVYMDKASGKSRTGRPQLEAMMDFVREGDVVVVESISRFARSTRDLLTLVEQLTDKGVGFVSQKESIDTNTPQGKFMLTVFGAMAELERVVLATMVPAATMEMLLTALQQTSVTRKIRRMLAAGRQKPLVPRNTQRNTKQILAILVKKRVILKLRF